MSHHTRFVPFFYYFDDDCYELEKNRKFIYKRRFKKRKAKRKKGERKRESIINRSSTNHAMLQRYRLEVVKSPRITLLIPEGRSLFFLCLFGNHFEKSKRKRNAPVPYRTSTCYGTGGTQKRERLGDKSAASLHQQLQYTMYKADSILYFFFIFLSFTVR